MSLRKLNVYILTNYTDFLPSNKPHPNVANAVEMFIGKSSFFDIKINLINVNNSKDEDMDYNFVKKSISMSLEVDPSSYVIVCKETSVSNLSSDTLLDHIQKCVLLSEKETIKSSFDIVWLSGWLSRCDQYTNYRELHKGTYLVDTTSTHGVQCLLFSPSGCNKFMKMNKVSPNTPLGLILNRSIRNRNANDIHLNFISSTITPSPINFDIRRGKEVYDYVKTCHCVDPPGTINSDKGGSDISLFVFIIIGAFITKIN